MWLTDSLYVLEAASIHKTEFVDHTGVVDSFEVAGMLVEATPVANIIRVRSSRNIECHKILIPDMWGIDTSAELPSSKLSIANCPLLH